MPAAACAHKWRQQACRACQQQVERGSMRREREGVGVIIRNSPRPSRHTEATLGPARSGSQTAAQASALRVAERRREHPLSGACRLAKEVCVEKKNRVYRTRVLERRGLCVCVCVCVLVYEACSY